MENLSKVVNRTLLFTVLGIVIVVIALFYVYSKNVEHKTPKTTQELSEIQAPPPPSGFPQTMEISGWVFDIDVSKNSFTITSRRDERYEVILGKKTELKEYIVPTFFSHDSPNASLEQIIPVSLRKLNTGDQVSITASVPIYSGEPIKEPIEVLVFH